MASSVSARSGPARSMPASGSTRNSRRKWAAEPSRHRRGSGMRGFGRALLGGALALGLCLGQASAETQEKPKYGGTLEVGTVYVTLSALSFDPADWNWKLNHDTGQFYE